VIPTPRRPPGPGLIELVWGMILMISALFLFLSGGYLGIIEHDYPKATWALATAACIMLIDERTS